MVHKTPVDMKEGASFIPGHPLNFKVTWAKNRYLAAISAFLQDNSSFISQIAMKLCTKLREIYKRYPIVLEGHLSDLNDTRAKKTLICSRFPHFRITPVSTQREIYEMRHKALRGMTVIIPFSKSDRPNEITRPVAAIKSIRYIYSHQKNEISVELILWASVKCYALSGLYIK